MSISDDQRDGERERCRRGIAFLHGARDLADLSSAQIDRIEQRLHRARPRARRPILTLSVAAMAIVLLAGAALAVTGTRLARLPIVGPGVDAILASIFTARPARRGPTVAGAGSSLAAEPRALLPERAPAGSPNSVVEAGTRSAAPTPALPRGQESGGPARSSVAAAQVAQREPDLRPATVFPTATNVQGEEKTGSGSGSARVMRPAPPAEPAGTASEPNAPVAPSSMPTPPRLPPSLGAPSFGVPPPAAAPETPIVAESRSFAWALEHWHRDHDAPAALAALDTYQRRFPRGEMQVEARLLRAEIFLAGAREREALALLDSLALSGLPRARELRTVRGELRTKLGRCAEGKDDLGAVLAQGIADSFARRARQALANCP